MGHQIIGKLMGILEGLAVGLGLVVERIDLAANRVLFRAVP